MDSHCLLVVCSGRSREGDRGTMTMLDAPRAEFFFKFSLQQLPPPPQLSLSLDRQQDVESVIGPFTLMKAALYATEMQLTLKITLDIAR